MKKLVLAMTLAAFSIGAFAGDSCGDKDKAAAADKDKAGCAEKSAAACPASKAAAQCPAGATAKKDGAQKSADAAKDSQAKK
jgi:hypothetical protein